LVDDEPNGSFNSRSIFLESFNIDIFEVW